MKRNPWEINKWGNNKVAEHITIDNRKYPTGTTLEKTYPLNT